MATPNHWHSLITIWAAQAGKNVYVEKPMSHDVVEGRVVVEAQKKYGVVIQHGTQSRSNASIAGLHDEIQAGKFGKLKISYGYCCKPRDSIGIKARLSAARASSIGRCGKAPPSIAQYNPNFVHYNWHWFWKTGNGDMNNQGTHQLDIARWALDSRSDGPRPRHGDRRPLQVERPGRNAQHDVRHRRIPQRPACVLQRAERELQGLPAPGRKRVLLRGRQQDLQLNKKGTCTFRPRATPRRLDIPPGAKSRRAATGLRLSRPVRAGNPAMANGNAVDAHYGSLMGHLMNNSYRLGKKVPFNAKAGRFGDDKDAHEHFMKLHAIMRDGVGVPENRPNTSSAPGSPSIPKPNATSANTPPKPTPCSKTPTTKASRCRPRITSDAECRVPLVHPGATRCHCRGLWLASAQPTLNARMRESTQCTKEAEGRIKRFVPPPGSSFSLPPSSFRTRAGSQSGRRFPSRRRRC